MAGGRAGDLDGPKGTEIKRLWGRRCPCERSWRYTTQRQDGRRRSRAVFWAGQRRRGWRRMQAKMPAAPTSPGPAPPTSPSR